MENLTLEINTLTAEEFIQLSKSVGWGVNRKYDMQKVAQALAMSSLTVVMRNPLGIAVGCGRAFSDDLTMTFIPDLFVRLEYQKRGVGRMMMEKMKEVYGHTNFFFGSQPGNESFFEKLGFKKGLPSYGGRFSESPYFVES